MVGRWRGDVVGLQGNTQRNMVIQAIGADGTVTGTWSGNAFTGTLRNGELAFTTTAFQKVTLRMTGADALEGFYETGGVGGGRPRRLSLLMQRRQ